MINIRQFNIFGLVPLMAFMIIGCGSSNNSKTYNITLSGDNEVPSVITSATGSGSLTLDTSSNRLTGSFSVSGLTATAGHIHIGFTGSNGDVLIPLELSGDSTTFTVPENTILDARGLASLNNGKLYINIHSTAVASGELRGQVLPSDVAVYKVALSGGQEVPAVTTSARGTAYLTLNKTSGNLYGTIKTMGMTPTAGHIHTGVTGINGDVLLAFALDETDGNNLNVSSNTVLDTTGLASLENEELYINIHSAAVASGELRGQIVP